ncbi:glycoside hydrolase family 32 protein [Sporolactobacillus kofuensis]|uniref:Glycoside hydrolase family 32 protein n=1 Tax=Sporolactobacillus kofuensis TaxID=269672 RepID=A0ABW1WD29_9BACL|nr:glycoside hydrolase family 32 protein [Sporolactobacillus kofuensis]MCO7175810.1 glycoside hydrolase family 32 protein [Sporolactobacillus kofuensis]
MKKKFFVVVSLVTLSLLILTIIILFSGLFQPKEKPVIEKKKQTYRSVYHFTVPDKWMNDPQRPIYFNGYYHYYYLYNRDYPKGNGTEWRHAISKDLIHWKDEGVAIPKYTNKNGDIWTGSVVRDVHNTAGLGKHALVAIVTQPPANGDQEQFLWYSSNQGKTFKNYGDDPVLPNPGVKDFRDPKIIWDAERNQWIMLLAEGAKIGFYTSNNLKEWQYVSGFFTQNIGIVECPDLFQLRADDGKVKWVLGASANGKAAGLPNTYAYWTGSFDGKTFKPDNEEPQWLDHGFDWYAGVTFEDGRASDKLKARYAIAWMNNWDYPNNTPTLKEDFNGANSIVRRIRLIHRAGQYSLASQPLPGLEKMTESTKRLDTQHVEGVKTLDVQGDAYQLDADLSWSDAQNVGLRLRESKDKTRHIDVGVFVKGGYIYVNRAFTGQPDKSNKSVESRVAIPSDKKQVHLKIFVDKTSIEVFVDDGQTVFSDEVFPHLNDQGISLFSEGGTSTFKTIEIKKFRSILQ